jgi:hypothetical protein
LEGLFRYVFFGSNGNEESEWWKSEPRNHRKHIVKEGIKEKA